MRALAISAAMTGALVLCGGWAIWRLYVGFSGMATTELRILALAGEILRLDEVLTMSARMSVATGDPKWETRYRANEPVLDAIIKETTALAPEAYVGTSAAETDDANIKLVAMEHRAFDLVREGKPREASDVLFSNEYETQKVIYSRGMMDSNRAILHRATSSLATQRFHILFACGLCAAILVVLAISWRRILRLIVTYLRTTEAAESTLAGVNRDLEKRTADLRERTSELETTIAELAGTQDKIARRHEDIETPAREVAQVIARMRAGMEAAAPAAAKTAEAANQVAAITREGRALSAQSMTSMGSLLKHGETTNKRLQQLLVKIREVTGVSRLIDEIASQTRFLALNASIEASRAGLAGHAFAVVAGEVRELANSTADKTSKIEELVHAIIADLEPARADMEESRALGAQTARSVEAVDERLAQVNELAEQTSKHVGEIAQVIEDENQSLGALGDATRNVVTSLGELREEVGRISEAA